MHVVCIGGGAASFFFAAELTSRLPGVDVTILEQGRQVLGKVRISGGGRCNVTHHCFDPTVLVKHYPRGGDHLLEPFTRFGPKELVGWFAQRNVQLKTESDGRMFPVTDDSKTITDCLQQACDTGGVRVITGAKAKNIKFNSPGFRVETLQSGEFSADKLMVAPGSSNQMWQVLEHVGHTIVSPVPSLFTLQIKDERIAGLAGISIPSVRVKALGIEESGPLLITHKGLSGPAILKMSAWGAHAFHEADYQTDLVVDFRPELEPEVIRAWRDSEGKKLAGNYQVLGLPKRLTARLLEVAGLDAQKKFASCSNREMDLLTEIIKQSKFQVIGQNRFKEEFVTAGGVALNEVDLQNFASRLVPGIHLAGEVLNIDAVTGGFNFQAAWTGAWHAARAVASESAK